jgi:hypothetical protein
MQTATLKLIKHSIRQKIKSLLVNKTDAQANVFVSRSTKFDHEELPAILIYPDSERIRRFEEAPKRYGRNFACKIEVIGRAATDEELDLQLETIAEQIETLLEVNETAEATLGPLVNDLNLTGSRYAFEGEAQTPVGSLILDYDFEFFDYALPEGIELPAFLGVDSKIKLPETEPLTSTDADRAKNKIDLPQT